MGLRSPGLLLKLGLGLFQDGEGYEVFPSAKKS